MGALSLRKRAADESNPEWPRQPSTLAAGPDKRLSLIDEPARAQTDDPMPGRGFSVGQARIAFSGFGSPRPVIVEEVVFGTMPDRSGIGGALQTHERSPVLWAKITAELRQRFHLSVPIKLMGKPRRRPSATCLVAKGKIPTPQLTTSEDEADAKQRL